MPFYGYSDPIDTPDYAANGWQMRAPDSGYAVGQYFKSAWENSAGPQIFRGLHHEIFDPIEPYYLYKEQHKARRALLQEQYGDVAGFEVQPHMTEAMAAAAAQRKMRETAALTSMNQAGLGAGWQLGVGLAAGLLDPVNVGLSFTPIPWMGRFHALAEGLSGLSRVGARAAIGAFEGAVGGAMFEPIAYSLSRGEGNDYTFKDSLLNVFLAAGAGSVARPLFLGMSDVKVSPKTMDMMELADYELAGDNFIDLETVPRNQLPKDFAAKVPQIEGVPLVDNLPRIAKDFDFDTKVSAIAKAVDQMAAGEDINVLPVFENARQRQLEQLAQSSEKEINFRPIKAAVAVNLDNSELPVNYAIVELRDLVLSHTFDGMENPEYPSAMQPRDRSQSTSQLQVLDIANKLNPMRLGETFDATTGAPIVGTDGVVESGNGRTLAITMAYGENAAKAQEYRNFLLDNKYDIDGFDEPVLVRMSDAKRDIDARIDFAQIANGRQLGSYNAVEQASIDAAKLDLDDLLLHKGGAVTKAENASFARRALDKIASAADMGELIDAKTNRLSQAGEDRISAAIVQMAYGSKSIVRDLFTRTDDELRGIGVALSEVAPKWAQMRTAAQAGNIHPNADVTAHLVSAVDIVRRLRQEKIKIDDFLLNRDMYEEIEPATIDILHVFFGDDLKRQVSVARIKAGLNRSLEQSMLSEAVPDIFGEVRDVRAEDYTRIARNAAKIEDGFNVSKGQALGDGGNDGGGSGSGNQSETKNLPSEPRGGASEVAPKQNGVERLLGDYDDPELKQLMDQDLQIDDMMANFSAQGLFDDAVLQEINGQGIDKAVADIEADALSAASYCLSTTKGGLI
jgi:hypothetical protein